MSTIDEKNTYHKYTSRDDRIAAWKKYRVEYNSWRRTEQAQTFIEKRRKKQQQLCFICVKPLGEKVHVDHIFPLYYGGTNAKANLCVTHPKCNMDKGTSVYTSYKQAGHRRRQFKLLRKARRAEMMLKRSPNAKLSKKDIRAIKLKNNLVSLVD